MNSHPAFGVPLIPLQEARAEIHLDGGDLLR